MATIDSATAGAVPSFRRRLASLCTAVAAPTSRKAAATVIGTQRFSLEGKIALITAGAGDLFGSSVTEALAEAGATVIVASRSLERNQSYAEAMEAHGYAGGAKGYAVDISDPESIAELRASIERDYGRLDILVNNALSRDGHGRDEGQPTQTLAKVQKVAAGEPVVENTLSAQCKRARLNMKSNKCCRGFCWTFRNVQPISSFDEEGRWRQRH